MDAFPHALKTLRMRRYGNVNVVASTKLTILSPTLLLHTNAMLIAKNSAVSSIRKKMVARIMKKESKAADVPAAYESPLVKDSLVRLFLLYRFIALLRSDEVTIIYTYIEQKA